MKAKLNITTRFNPVSVYWVLMCAGIGYLIEPSLYAVVAGAVMALAFSIAMSVLDW